MNDDALQEVYRRTRRPPDDPERAACPSPEALLAVADGSAGEEARLDAMEHVADCPLCEPELALLRQVVQARPAVRTAVPVRWLAAAATVAVAFLGVRAVMTGGDDPVVRGAGDAVELVSPVGPVGEAGASLRWRAVEGATRYEVEIVDDAGALVFSATVRDTALPIPQGVRPGVTHRWSVSAIRRDGSRVESAAAELTLSPR